MRYRATIIVLGIVLGFGVVSSSPADAAPAGGGNNIVIANNTTDGYTLVRSNALVARDPADTVANNNLAIANSTTCTTGCHTVAVAMQVVIVESYPSTFIPANVASATNGGCDSCVTEAYAFQHFVQPGVSVNLGADAQQALAALRQQVRDVAAADLPILDRKAALEQLFDQMVAVVDQGIQAVGGNPVGSTSESSQAA